MSTTERQSVHDRLASAGACDVKFFFNADLNSRLPSQVKAQASFLLDTYLQDFKTEYKPAGELTHIAS